MTRAKPGAHGGAGAGRGAQISLGGAGRGAQVRAPCAPLPTLALTSRRRPCIDAEFRVKLESGLRRGSESLSRSRSAAVTDFTVGGSARAVESLAVSRQGHAVLVRCSPSLRLGWLA